MEIQLIIHRDWQMTSFKIDLIVWKLFNTVNKTAGHYGFKIDLIVWKFENLKPELESLAGLKQT